MSSIGVALVKDRCNRYYVSLIAPTALTWFLSNIDDEFIMMYKVSYTTSSIEYIEELIIKDFRMFGINVLRNWNVERNDVGTNIGCTCKCQGDYDMIYRILLSDV